MTAQRLLDTIARQEGFRPDVYKDTRGYWTVGIGALVTKDDCSAEEASAMCGAPWTYALAEQRMGTHVAEVEAELAAKLPWFAGLPDLPRWGLTDMAYQLGVRGVLMFAHMLGALEAGDYAKAERDALNSLWAHQTPNRAREVAAWIGNHEPA